MSFVALSALLVLSFVFLSSATYHSQLHYYWDSHGHLSASNSSCLHKWVPHRSGFITPHTLKPQGHAFHINSYGNSTPPPGPPKICLPPNLIVGHLNISEWNLVPLTLAGMAVGVGGFTYLTGPQAANIRSRYSYAIIFAFFFLMNFSAIILHCFSPTINSAFVAKLMLFLDGFGTSGVCLSFVIAALADLNVITDDGKVKLTLSGVIYAVFLYGWYQAIFGGWPLGFPLLYLLTTVVGSISYFVLEFVWLIKNGFNKTSFYLLSSLLIGMVGLQTFKDPTWAQYLCDHIPQWLAGETPWFLASDLSLYLLFLYATKREGSLYAKLKSMVCVEEGMGACSEGKN